jgi:hypothetical protein
MKTTSQMKNIIILHELNGEFKEKVINKELE